MARIPKLLALGGLVAGAAAFVRSRRGGAAATPASTPSPAPVPPAATTPAPPDAPGPSVTAAGAGASEAEREEAATATAPDPEVLQRQAGGPVDQLVEEETSAAAAEAGAIGGRAGSRAAEDPAMEPVYEAGGGEAEGFEEAEAELIEAASHGDSRANPIEDAITPEVESDLSTAAYGEPDEEDVTEVTRDVDPATGKPREEDDPGEGPGIAADR